MKFIYLTLGLIAIGNLWSCKNDTKNTEKHTKEKIISNFNENKNLNISFLLDLSDRINPKKYPNEAMEYYHRDTEYIKSVVLAFNRHLRTKKVRTLNDKIQLFFDPEPSNQKINKLSTNLKFQITKNNVSEDYLQNLVKTYTTVPLEIYNLAIEDNKYIGSDTWRFFKNKISNYCIETDHRNILVILTDGYIYHKNTIQKELNRSSFLIPKTIRDFKLNSANWEEKIKTKDFGFIATTSDLSNLEILVLGINPDKKNPHEEDVIKTYWTKWFVEMKVKKFQILNADLPSNLDKTITNFILPKE